MFDLFSVNGMKRPKLLILIIILIEGIGFLSGFIGTANQAFYESLIKPSFSPPGWVFGVVWTILYFLMAVALYRILIMGEQGENTGKSLILFFTQLILNFFWPIIFFRFRLYGMALIELLILFIFILLTISEFFKIDRKAAYIMILYLLWVLFAGVLNYAFWELNR